MAKPGIAGVVLALTLLPATAMSQIMEPRIGAPPIPQMPSAPMVMPAPRMPMPAQPMPMPMPAQAMPGMPMRPGPMPAMPMRGGPAPMQMAGGYVAPSYGYTLPRQWVAPGYFVANYRAFGLARPAWGFGWSRYYDDFVLTDRWGRVYDWRRGDDARSGGGIDCRRRRGSGIVGAIVGGVVGAVAGNVIAGAGDRLAGSLIGGGVGALAGQAIDRGSHRGRCTREGYYEDDGYDRPDPRPHWDMAWAGGCQCTQTVTEVVEPGYPIVTRKVSYVTEYVRVPVRTKYVVTRTKYVRRGKYVPLD